MSDYSFKNYINEPDKYVIKQQEDKLVTKKKGIDTWFDAKINKESYNLTKIYEKVSKSNNLAEECKKSLTKLLKKKLEIKKPPAKPNFTSKDIKTLFLSKFNKPLIQRIYRESIQKSLSKEKLTLVPAAITSIETKCEDLKELSTLRALYITLSGENCDHPNRVNFNDAATRAFKQLDLSNCIADLMINNQSKGKYYFNKEGQQVDKPGVNVIQFEISIESETGSDEIKIMAKPNKFLSQYNVEENSELKLIDNTTTTVGEWFKKACNQSFVIKKENFLNDLQANCQEKGVNAPELEITKSDGKKVNKELK